MARSQSQAELAEEIEEIERLKEEMERLKEEEEDQEVLPDPRLFQERSKESSLILGRVSSRISALSKADPIDLRVGGKVPTIETLVEKLELQFSHQNRMNQANLQLNYLNYVLTMANFVKNKKLENALQEGHKRIRALVRQIKADEKDIQDLKISLEVLNLEVEENRKKAQEIEVRLVETQSSLQSSMNSYHAEVVKQRKTVEEWNKTKFRHDFLFDAFTGIVGGVLVNQFIVHYPIQLLTSFLFLEKKPRTFMTGLTKLALWFSFMHYAKQQAKQFGLHNNVGSWVDYITRFSSKIMALGGANLPPSSS